MGAGCNSSLDQDALRLAEATRLVEQGREMERASYADAATFYQEALEKTEAFVARQPVAPLARSVARDEQRIGPYTLTELREHILPLTRQKAEAEESPLACALLLARTTKDASQRAKFLTDIAKTYAQLGQPEKIHAIVQNAGDAAHHFLGALFEFYFATKQYQQAWTLAQGIEDEEVKDWAVEWIAHEHTKSGRLEEAFQAARSIEDPPLQAETLAAIVDAYTSVGQAALSVDWGGWKAVSQWSIPRSPDRWYLPVYDREKVNEVLHLAQQSIEAVEEFTPKMNLLAALARGYVAAGDYDQALHIVTKLRASELKAKVITAVAARQASTGQRAPAIALLGQAVNLGKTVLDPPTRTGILKEVARAYVNAGDDHAALQLAAAFKDPLARAEVLAFVVRRQAVCGQPDAALRLAHTIADNGSRARSIAFIARTYSDKGLTEEAKKLMDETDRALPAIARRYTTDRQYEQAQLVAEAMSDPATRASVLLDIALALFQASDIERGTATLNRAIRTVDAIAAPAEKEQTRIAMARTLTQSRQFSPARQVAETVADPSARTDLYAEMARDLFALGDETDGAAALAQVLRSSRNVRDSGVKARTLARSARHMIAVGRLTQATKVAAWIEDASTRKSILANIARAYLESEQYDNAVRVARSIVDTFTRSQTLAAIVRRALAGERVALAWQYALMIPAVSEKDRTLLTVANWYIAHGQPDEALAIAAMINTTAVKTKLFREMMRAYLAADQEEPALRLIMQVQEPFARAELSAMVARYYAAAGRQSEALRLAQTIVDLGLRERTLKAIAQTTPDPEGDSGLATLPPSTDRDRRALIKKLIRAGEYEQARREVSAMHEDADRVLLLFAIARHYEEAQHQEQASVLFAQAQHEATALRDETSRARVFAHFARHFAKTGCAEQTLRATKKIEVTSLRNDALVDLARVCMEQKQFEHAVILALSINDRMKAMRVLSLLVHEFMVTGRVERATRIVEQATDPYIHASLLVDIARLYGQSGQKDQAAKALLLARRAIERLEAPDRADFLSTLVREYLTSGDTAQALQVAQELTDIQVRAGLVTMIARQEVREERLEQALKLATRIEDPAARSEILSEITLRHLDGGRYENAMLVASAVADRATRADLTVKIAHEELARLSAEKGEGRESPAFSSQSIHPEQAYTVASEELAYLARAYVEAGQDERAAQLLDLMDASSEKVLAMAEMANVYEKRGARDKAEATFVRALQEAGALNDLHEKEKAVVGVGVMLAATRRPLLLPAIRTTLRQIIADRENEQEITVSGKVRE